MRNKIYIFVLVLIVTGCKSPKADFQRHKEEIDRTLRIVEGKSYNKNLVMVVDYSLHSGVERLYLYETLTYKEVYRTMVAHGINSGRGSRAESFSNIRGSLQSSLGIGVIGQRDYSTRGINVKYWLHGLEPTNNNMESRLIVLHSYQHIPNSPVYPKAIVHSEGCLMISDKAFRELDKIIQNQGNKKIPFIIFA